MSWLCPVRATTGPHPYFKGEHSWEILKILDNLNLGGGNDGFWHGVFVIVKDGLPLTNDCYLRVG